MSFNDDFLQELTDRRDKEFTNNQYSYEDEAGPTLFALSLGGGFHFPLGLSIIGELEGFYGQDRDSEKRTNETTEVLSNVLLVLLVPLSQALITTTLHTYGYMAMLNACRIFNISKIAIRPFARIGAGQINIKERWKIIELGSLFGDTTGKNIEITFNGHASIYDTSLGLEFILNAKGLIKIFHGRRVAKSDSLDKEITAKGAEVNDQLDTKTELKGNYFGIFAGIYF